MQRHVGGTWIACAIAITAFILAISLGHYMVAYATIIVAFFAGGAYVIAVAKFPNRMDPDDEDPHGRKKKGT
jgi:hypothetical protein